MNRILLFFLLFTATIVNSHAQYGQYLCTIDTILVDIDKYPRFPKTADRFNMLVYALNNYQICARININGIQLKHDEKQLNKVELAYNRAQKDVNLYLDSLILYIQIYPLKKESYYSYNKELKTALTSIGKLNKLFKKYNYTPEFKKSIILINKSSINKVVKHTLGWKDEFINYRVGDDSHEYINKLKLTYWKPWNEIK